MTGKTDREAALPRLTPSGEKIDADELRDEIDWRMGFVGGYCASTNQPHEADSFDEHSGFVRRLTGNRRFVCADCGMSVPSEAYHRLDELMRLRDGLEASAKTVEISVPDDGG